MLRSFFISLSKANWAKNLITNWSFAWRLASRFIAGEKLEDAIQAIKVLNGKGINATLDHLGEHVSTPDETRQAAQDVIDVLEQIGKAGVCANVSLKLSQLGLLLDRNLCVENLTRILERAGQLGNFIRIDMEDSAVTQITLDVLYEMRQKGFRNIGTVIQAYLYRSEADVRKLMDEGIWIRLCKGAYQEPAKVAFPKKRDVDANYDLLVSIMMDSAKAHGAPALSKDCRIPPLPALATHDPKRIEYGKAYAQKIGLPKEAMEFQMLHGIRRDLQEELAKEGYPVRVYVPYGTQWYPYFMRRLAERPANLWFILSNYFRK
jgi:proline dehydrogenase